MERESKVLLCILGFEMNHLIHRRCTVDIIPFLEIGGVNQLFGGCSILCPCTSHPSHHEEYHDGTEQLAG